MKKVRALLVAGGLVAGGLVAGGPATLLVAGVGTIPANAAAADTPCPAPVITKDNFGRLVGTVTCSYTGGPQTWTPPSGVNVAFVDIEGGQGGSSTKIPGGRGGRAKASLLVASGKTYTVLVGGQGGAGDAPGNEGGAGGFNGGASGGHGSTGDLIHRDGGGAGGGGASEIDLASTRLVVAGGGGGGGGDRDRVGGGGGGLGGGDTGTAGSVADHPETVGQPGTATAAGAGGEGLKGDNGSAGSGASGGKGGDFTSTFFVGSGGGGGGGGFFGGGGGGADWTSSTLGRDPAGSGGGGSGHIDGSAISGGMTVGGGPSGDGTVVIRYLLGETTTTVTSSVNPSVSGQSVSFTATVASPEAGVPTGRLTFYDGTTDLGSTTLPAAAVSVRLPRGSHSITAVYSGDQAFTGSTSAPLTQTVNQAPTTTTVTSSLNPSASGQPVSFTAVINVAPGYGTPTGNILFLDNSVLVARTTLPSRVVSVQLPVGTHSITAVYLGDDQFGESTSAVLTQTVDPAPTTTTVTSSVNPTVSGQGVSFTATVASPEAGVPTGRLTFYDGTTDLGSTTLPSRVLTVRLPRGNHSITAVYSGDQAFAGSTSAPLIQTVNQAPTTTTVTSSLNPSAAGQKVSFTATVTPTFPGFGVPTGLLTFFDGSTYLGTATLPSEVVSVRLPAGAHEIYAIYSGDPNFGGSTSPALAQTVK